VRVVVAAEVDRVGVDARVLGVAQVGDPDRPPVAAAAGGERAEEREVVAPRRAAGPDPVARLDAARRVAGGQFDEVADLPQVDGVGVGDDVEAARARGVAVLRAEPADPGAARLVDVVVARVERADDAPAGTTRTA
jgi:hypothetical protein